MCVMQCTGSDRGRGSGDIYVTASGYGRPYEQKGEANRCQQRKSQQEDVAVSAHPSVGDDGGAASTSIFMFSRLKGAHAKQFFLSRVGQKNKQNMLLICNATNRVRSM